MKNKLIIEINYNGLGDHLFHSHIPRIAKELGIYQEVYISNRSLFGHPDYKKLVWELNPYIDGFCDEPGIRCDIANAVAKVNPHSPTNLLDQVMYAYGLDNKNTWNQPEIYYRPRKRKEFEYTVFDPNFVSWIGNVTEEDAMTFFKKEGIHFERIMKIRGTKKMFTPDKETVFLETPTLFDFCDLIISARKLYCLTSGTATLASALHTPAIVFYGQEQEDGFKHYKDHQYVLIPRYFSNRLLRKLRKVFHK